MTSNKGRKVMYRSTWNINLKFPSSWPWNLFKCPTCEDKCMVKCPTPMGIQQNVCMAEQWDLNVSHESENDSHRHNGNRSHSSVTNFCSSVSPVWWGRVCTLFSVELQHETWNFWTQTGLSFMKICTKWHSKLEGVLTFQIDHHIISGETDREILKSKNNILVTGWK